MLLAFPAGKTVTVDIPILQTRTFINTYTHYRPYELRLLIFPRCSNPPAFVSLTRKQNKKLQRSNYARAFLVGAGGLRKPRI